MEIRYENKKHCSKLKIKIFTIFILVLYIRSPISSQISLNSYNNNNNNDNDSYNITNANINNPGYAIFTTELVKNKSKELQNFIEYKEKLGFNVYLISVEKFKNKTGQERALAIQDWLKNNTNNLNLQYILFIGNPDSQDITDPQDDFGDVPMVYCYPEGNATSSLSSSFSTNIKVSTDLIFADPYTQWDSDNDNILGEYFDDNFNEKKLSPELFIGRIPYYSEADPNCSSLDFILANTINHHALFKNKPEVKSRILEAFSILYSFNEMGTAESSFDGKHFPEYLYTNILSKRGMNDTILYEQEGLNAVPSSTFHFNDNTPLTSDILISEFNKQNGLVFLSTTGTFSKIFRTIWTHDSNENNAPEINELQELLLLDVKTINTSLSPLAQSFIILTGEDNGNPEYSENLATAFLESGSGINILAPTAFNYYVNDSWHDSYLELYGDTTSLMYSFLENLLVENMPSGKALFNAKSSIGDNWGIESYINKLTFTLYGDPQLGYWKDLPAQPLNYFNFEEAFKKQFSEKFMERFFHKGFEKKSKEKQGDSNTSIFAHMVQSLLSFTLVPLILGSFIMLSKPDLQGIISWYKISKMIKKLQSTFSKSFSTMKRCPSPSNIQAFKQHINSLTDRIEKKLELLNTLVLNNTRKEQNIPSKPIINILEIQDHGLKQPKEI